MNLFTSQKLTWRFPNQIYGYQKGNFGRSDNLGDWAQSLGWEDPLEMGMAAHSTILAWRIPWTEGLGRLYSMRLQRV